MRLLRADFDVLAAILGSITTKMSYRDETRMLFELYRELRDRVETLEKP